MGYSVGVNILHSGFNEGRLREEKIMGHGAACELGKEAAVRNMEQL